VEFETRKLQELQSTFENDWLEFCNIHKARQLVRNLFPFSLPNQTYFQPIENNKSRQIFIYNTNEVSLETLFNPKSHPINQQIQSFLINYPSLKTG